MFPSAGLAAVAAPSAPPTPEPFDPSAFGRVLSPDELDKIDGNYWTLIAGAVIGAASHVLLNGVEVDSWEWWGGLAVSVALGMVPVTGVQVAAAELTGAAKIAAEAWGLVAGTIVTTGPRLAMYFDEQID